MHEIANAFLTNDETITKRIYRAKEKIRKEKIELEVPAHASLNERIDAVLHALYLLFNEGYNSSHPDKREVMISQVLDGIVDKSATEWYFPDDALLCFPVIRENI